MSKVIALTKKLSHLEQPRNVEKISKELEEAKDKYLQEKEKAFEKLKAQKVDLQKEKDNIQGYRGAN